MLSIDEEGVRFRSYIDGDQHFLSPERSMEVQALLGSDIALAFDECTPFNADRDYTAALDRAHAPLARPLPRLARRARPAPAGRLRDRPGRRPRGPAAESAGAAVGAAAVDGIAIGGTLGRDKEQMREVLEMTLAGLPAEAPKHLLGIGEPDDLVEGIARGIDTFDCAVPTRLGRHGMALAPLPERRFRFDIRNRREADERGPLVEGCPCPACSRMSRAYVHYLSRAEELTGVRLVTLHNLVYTEAIVAGAREAIAARRLRPASATRCSAARRPGRRRAEPGSTRAGSGCRPQLPASLVDQVLDRLDLVAEVVADVLADVGVASRRRSRAGSRPRRSRRRSRSAARRRGRA